MRSAGSREDFFSDGEESADMRPANGVSRDNPMRTKRQNNHQAAPNPRKTAAAAVGAGTKMAANQKKHSQNNTFRNRPDSPQPDDSGFEE